MDGAYHVTTNRWQTVSDETVDEALFDRLGGYCDGFLVHAVDSEGRSSGVDGDLIRILAKAKQEVCYAGGISSYDDIRRIVDIGSGKVDFTVGSRLDIFGGSLSIEEIIRCIP
jgi:phosphoribosylformimino-5-aminoimidazole carboxamide ribotide isomerase